jgi:hypothetical protein
MKSLWILALALMAATPAVADEVTIHWSRPSASYGELWGEKEPAAAKALGYYLSVDQDKDPKIMIPNGVIYNPGATMTEQPTESGNPLSSAPAPKQVQFNQVLGAILKTIPGQRITVNYSSIDAIDEAHIRLLDNADTETLEVLLMDDVDWLELQGQRQIDAAKKLRAEKNASLPKAAATKAVAGKGKK